MIIYVFNFKNKFEVEHTFQKKRVYNIYRSILKCDQCNQKFLNDDSYSECKDCQIKVHKDCEKQAKKNCKASYSDDLNDFPEEIDLNVRKNKL
jgi:hypothetical protein